MKFSPVIAVLYFAAFSVAREKRQDTEPQGYDVKDFVAGCSADEGCKYVIPKPRTTVIIFNADRNVIQMVFQPYEIT